LIRQRALLKARNFLHLSGLLRQGNQLNDALHGIAFIHWAFVRTGAMQYCCHNNHPISLSFKVTW
jgi:hypothetical protein